MIKLKDLMTENTILSKLGVDKMSKGHEMDRKVRSNLDLNGFSDDALVLHFKSNPKRINKAEKFLSSRYDNVAVYNPSKALGGPGYPLLFVE